MQILCFHFILFFQKLLQLCCRRYFSCSVQVYFCLLQQLCFPWQVFWLFLFSLDPLFFLFLSFYLNLGLFIGTIRDTNPLKCQKVKQSSPHGPRLQSIAGRQKLGENLKKLTSCSPISFYLPRIKCSVLLSFSLARENRHTQVGLQ